MAKYKFGENWNKEKSDWVRIFFADVNDEQMKHLMKAERELMKAGVDFDTGFDGKERDWDFDWSLKGARVKIKTKK